VLAVVGVIDDVDGDDSRPIRVENRHGEASEQEVGDELNPVTVKRVEPYENSVVTNSELSHKDIVRSPHQRT
jgi:hypothetical protein